jgi:hypothetical protein
MQFVLLIHEEEARFNNLSKPELGKELAEYQAFGKDNAKVIQSGAALQPTANTTTVRVRKGKRLTTDGPFAEAKEQLGGFYLVEAASREEAIEMAAKIPGARFGSVEVRPVQKFA